MKRTETTATATATTNNAIVMKEHKKHFETLSAKYHYRYFEATERHKKNTAKIDWIKATSTNHSSLRILGWNNTDGTFIRSTRGYTVDYDKNLRSCLNNRDIVKHYASDIIPVSEKKPVHHAIVTPCEQYSEKRTTYRKVYDSKIRVHSLKEQREVYTDYLYKRISKLEVVERLDLSYNLAQRWLKRRNILLYDSMLRRDGEYMTDFEDLGHAGICYACNKTGEIQGLITTQEFWDVGVSDSGIYIVWLEDIARKDFYQCISNTVYNSAKHVNKGLSYENLFDSNGDFLGQYRIDDANGLYRLFGHNVISSIIELHNVWYVTLSKIEKEYFRFLLINGHNINALSKHYHLTYKAAQKAVKRLEDSFSDYYYSDDYTTKKTAK